MKKFRNIHAAGILLAITCYVSAWILGALYHGIEIWKVQLPTASAVYGHRKNELHTSMATLSKEQREDERMANGKLYGRTGEIKKKRSITARGD